MNARRWWLAAAIAVPVVAGLAWEFLAGPSARGRDAEREPAIETPQRVAIIGGEPVVTLDAATQRTSGLETAILKTKRSFEQARAYAAVLDLQPLTELSNNYVAAQSARQTALAKLAASKPAFERAQALYRDRAASAAQLQAAEAAFHIDEAGVAAADSQLRTLTTSARQAWGPALAQALVERSPIFIRLIERRDVLLQATLPPGVSVAKAPTDATVAVPDGTRAPLQFVSPATRTDPRIQGVSFFYTAAADSGLLPGMSVVVFVPIERAIEGTGIPASAVVWWQGRAWVYVKTAMDSFARREIATDRPAPDGGYVVAQPAAGSEIVVRGAQMLLSEELRSPVRADGR